MLINTKEIVGAPVISRSGQSIGKVASFDLDQATGRLATMHVRTPGLVPGLSKNEVLVPWHAIIEITPKQVTVIDGTVKSGAALAAQVQPDPIMSVPSLMKEG